MPILIILYVFLAFIIALLGQNRKFGFWGYFFGSLLLTPIIGILLVIASDKRLPNKGQTT
ncbi:MAG: hypothetical protein HQK79_06030 [Desulfobacterales bacterium]|nr:hypothetical protein [Desulfobacterales bacterium]MBF0395451.1 hypothetical protein [Desulfobacterales bacterium]